MRARSSLSTSCSRRLTVPSGISSVAAISLIDRSCRKRSETIARFRASSVSSSANLAALLVDAHAGLRVVALCVHLRRDLVEQRLPALPPACCIVAAVHRNAVQPGTEWRLRSIACQVAIGSEKRLLRHILRIVAIAEDHVGRTNHRRGMCGDQAIERDPIAALRRAHERRIACRIRRRRTGCPLIHNHSLHCSPFRRLATSGSRATETTRRSATTFAERRSVAGGAAA